MSFSKLLIAIALFTVLAGCSTGYHLTAEQCFAKGNAMRKEGKSLAAYKFFNAAIEKDRSNLEYHWAAATCAPNSNEAFRHTEYAWKQGLKRQEVLMALLRLSLHTKKTVQLEYALALFKELPDSLETPIFRGSLFFQFNEYDSSIACWQPLFKAAPNPDLASMIALAYSRNRADTAAFEFLTYCRQHGLLDRNSYIMQATLLATKYRFSAIDSLFEEMKTKNQYDSAIQIEHADFLIAQGRFDEAQKLLVPFLTSKPEKDTPTRQRARLQAAYILKSTNRSPEIADIIKKIPRASSTYKLEESFLAAIMAPVSNDVTRFKKMVDGVARLVNEPVTRLALAQEYSLIGNHKRAALFYKNLPTIFLYAPRILVLYAHELAMAGGDDEAVQYLNLMHSQGFFTRTSMQMYRDINFKRKFIDRCFGAQHLLEKKYKDDVQILWNGGLLAFNAGKTDSALDIFSRLSKQYPQETLFPVTKINLLLILRKYQAVIDECNSSKVPIASIAAVKARAYHGLNNDTAAAQVLNEALTTSPNPKLLADAADFFLETGNFTKSAELYARLLKNSTTELSKDSIAFGMILNNFGWALLQSGNAQQDTILQITQKALAINPKDLNTLETHCTALRRFGKNKECIALLENTPGINKEPGLLYHLACAYEGVNEQNKALRTFQDALKTIDSVHVLPVSVSRDSLKKHIAAIINP